MYPHELKLVCEWDFLIDRDTNVHVAFRMRFKNPKKFAFWFLYFCLWSKSWRNSHFQTKLLHNKSCAKWKHSTLTKTCWKLSENIHKLKYFKNWPLNYRDLGHFWVSFTLMIKGQQKTILFFSFACGLLVNQSTTFSEFVSTQSWRIPWIWWRWFNIFKWTIFYNQR